MKFSNASAESKGNSKNSLMKIILLSLFVLAIFLVGCEQAAEKVIENKIERESGEDVDVDFEDDGVTVSGENEEGEFEVTSSGFDSAEWCQEGAEWKFTGSNEEGASNAQWTVAGLQSSGEYKGLCHVVYTAAGPDGEMRMDYYFAEDRENGYFEWEINGKTFSSEWHS